MAFSRQDFAAWTKSVIESSPTSHEICSFTENYNEHGEVTSRSVGIKPGGGAAKTENVSDSESPTQPKKPEDLPEKGEYELPSADQSALCSNLDKLMREVRSLKDRRLLQEARSFVARERRNFQVNFQLRVILSDGTERHLYNGDRSNQAVVDRNGKGDVVCMYERRDITTTLYDGVRGALYIPTNILGWLFGGGLKKAIGF